jgi:hypothetical protein
MDVRDGPQRGTWRGGAVAVPRELTDAPRQQHRLVAALAQVGRRLRVVVVEIVFVLRVLRERGGAGSDGREEVGSGAR